MTATAPAPSIDVIWADDNTLYIALGDELSWRIELGATPATRMMTTMGGALPEAGWRSNTVLARGAHRRHGPAC
jgi:predicted component of type VI protein secretion system